MRMQVQAVLIAMCILTTTISAANMAFAAVHRHPVVAVVAPPQVEYYFKSISTGARMAICLCWAKSGNGIISVPDGFITAEDANRLYALGVKVLRLPSDGRSINSGVTYTTDTYEPRCWLRISPGTRLISYQYSPVKPNQLAELSGWLRLTRHNGKWHASKLRAAPAPYGIESFILKDLVWKPTRGAVLDLYVNNPNQFRTAIKETYVHLHKSEEYRDLQSTNKAYAAVDFDNAYWIDQRTAMDSYTVISKYETSDVSEEITRTFMFRHIGDRWQEVDIGIAAEGE